VILFRNAVHTQSEGDRRERGKKVSEITKPFQTNGNGTPAWIGGGNSWMGMGDYHSVSGGYLAGCSMADFEISSLSKHDGMSDMSNSHSDTWLMST
jgi:hypothetical protein